MKLKYLGVFATLVAALFAMEATIQAAPNTTFTWTEPTNYEDGTIIPATDVMTYGLYCGTVSGGPYTFYGNIGVDTTSAVNVDLNACVNGVPGTYYFVLTAHSGDFNAESRFSNETFRVYTAVDLGKVPLPPVIVSVQ